MKDKKENKKQTVEKNLSGFRMPGYNEIPDVGLYLKQVVKYVNDSVGEWFDIAVTETMLSNYVKMHMVPNAIKKQYYRDQIATMVFIVLAKTVLSLEDLQNLLPLIEKRFEKRESYERFATTFMYTLGEFWGSEVSTDGFDIGAVFGSADETEALLRNIVTAIVQNNYIKHSLQLLMEKNAD
ncbi:MAG: DUF1836 domain-containing protein [Eubacteriales bacterium]|nr:DUF1836 domain-containing protein [Eubacteriales bacterium]